MQSNAVRFINAYNSIDQTLRAVYNFRRNITFSDMIRRAVSINSVVRKYEDKLIDYARLRNAIIHNSNEERIIAEPHDEVVVEMEKIATLIASPPKVIDTIASKTVLVLDGNTPVKVALETIFRTGFKVIPVCEHDQIAGVINSHRLIELMGMQIENGRDLDEYIASTPVRDAVSDSDQDRLFVIKPKTLLIQEALDLFFANRKLQAIVITKSGSGLERPIGIVTVADIMDLSKVIEDYDV